MRTSASFFIVFTPLVSGIFIFMSTKAFLIKQFIKSFSWCENQNLLVGWLFKN